MRIAILLALSVLGAFAQGPEITISQGPAPNPFQLVYGYTGTNLVYVCYAKSVLPTSFSVAISAGTNANPVVFTSTGHGFNSNSRPKVTVSGGTGNWTAVNGTFTATITSANAFSIPVDSTAFGAVTGTLVYTTTAPRTNQSVWAVKEFSYDGSNNIIWAGWLNGSSAVPSSGGSKCSDATSTTLNVQ